MTNTSCSQNSALVIENLTPAVEDNVFPKINYSSNPRVEEKINTFLQLDNLYHLPNQFKNNPFEKVVYGHEHAHSSVYFYGYEKNKTPENILSLQLSGEATGAYSEGFEIYYNFDVRTGNKINLSDFLTEKGVLELTNQMNLKVKNTIEEFITSLNASPRDDDEYTTDQLDMYGYCLEDIEENSIGYYEFYFEEERITFVRGRCSNHALRALDDLGSFRISYSYSEIEEYLSSYGKGLLNGEKNMNPLASPDGKFYKGKINNKYPITVFISEVYSDKSLRMYYWYDSYKTPIEWDGNFLNRHFSLSESNYDEEKEEWIKKAKVEADLVGNKIIGTWTNLETNQVFKLALMEY